MAEWSVSAVGGNPHSAAFLGSALKTAEMLGLPKQFSDYVKQSVSNYTELTSPYPLVEGLGLSKGIQGGKSANEASAAQVPNRSSSGLTLA